jgi:hypothetical protein
VFSLLPARPGFFAAIGFLRGVGRTAPVKVN